MTETNTQLAKTHRLKEETIVAAQNIDEIVSRCDMATIRELPAMTQMIVVGKAVHDLRTALNEGIVNSIFMPLQGTRLGFKTDKDSKGGYEWQVVRDAMIEGMIKGFRPTNNEINIIGGNFYATLEGLDRKVSEYHGLTNLELFPGVPVLSNGDALVPYSATWLLNGKADSLECELIKRDGGEVVDRRIPVRVNAGQIIDAIMGKAKRKMLARILERISGEKVADGDVIDAVGTTVTEQRPRGVAAKAHAILDSRKDKPAPEVTSTPAHVRGDSPDDY